MLSRLEYVTFLVSDMRFEKLAKTPHQSSVAGLGSQESAKSGVILADPIREGGLSDGFEGREKMLLLDLEVRLEMA